jgi:hypothetical protein
MARQLVTIRFLTNEPRYRAKAPIDWVPQLLNFGEEVWGVFSGSRDVEISLGDIDRAKDRIEFVVNHKKQLRRILATVNDVRQKHFFDDITEVVVSSIGLESGH